jgi:hypothetical protein
VMAGEHQREADLARRNCPPHQTKSLEAHEEKELKAILACHCHASGQFQHTAETYGTLWMGLPGAQ